MELTLMYLAMSRNPIMVGLLCRLFLETIISTEKKRLQTIRLKEIVETMSQCRMRGEPFPPSLIREGAYLSSALMGL